MRSSCLMGSSEMGSVLRRTAGLALLLWLGLFAATGRAAVISVGTPTGTVPASLFDPIASLSSPLPADEFLLPIKIAGANGLQDWSFDLTFNDGVVQPRDVGGLFQSVYQAEFNNADATLPGA